MKRQKKIEKPEAAPPPSVMDTLKSAVLAQIQLMLSEGISASTLIKIERFCAAQRQALTAAEGHKAALRSLQAGLNISPLGYLGGGYGDDTVVNDADAPPTFPPLAGAPLTETYGANVIRQAMPALKEIASMISKNGAPPAMHDAVQALVTATQGGLSEEIIAPLRARVMEVCGVEASPPKTAKSLPANGHKNGANA